MREIWKTIEDFEAYSVSNMGRIKRVLPGPLGVFDTFEGASEARTEALG